MKYALVTGAYGGMGRKTVEVLRNNGFCVFAFDKKTEIGQENIIPIEVDVTDEISVENAFGAVEKITDRLDVIIHFAGMYMLDSLVEMNGDAFKRIFDVNVYGVFLINKFFLPMLNKSGKIIITTSELAVLDPLPFTGVYAVSKSTLDKYAYSLRMELQLLGISVSVLRAGAVDTGMLDMSMQALDSFCDKTKLYSCNSRRFKKIVGSVEARRISSEKLAIRVFSIVKARKPKFAYTINRNPLLLLLNAMPKRLQLWVIKKILE